MMTNFKKSIVIPLATYKKLSSSAKNNLNEKNEQKETDPVFERQQELLAQRMYNIKPYKILSTNQNIAKDSAFMFSGSTEKKEKIKPGISITEILSNIRQAQIPYIKEILRKMLELNYIWNEHGEIIIKGKIIRNSNVIRIMKFFSNASIKAEPIGTEELWVNISNHIPKSWFLNKPSKARKNNQSYILKKYPFEDQNMEGNRKNESDYSTDATDDEFSEDSTLNETILQKTEQPLLKKIPAKVVENTETDTDYISANEENKLEEASGGIQESPVKNISPLPYKEKKTFIKKNKQPEKKKDVKVTYPSLQEDVFGKITTKKHSPKIKSPYSSRYGRSIKRNPRFLDKEWASDW